MTPPKSNSDPISMSVRSGLKEMFKFMEIVERLGSKFADLEGFRKDVEDNEQIDQVLKELSCEYDVFSKYIDPKYRLAGLTGFQLMSTYKKNKIIKHQQEIIKTMNTDKTIDESITDKYSDI
jgi:hypothetical protein